MTVRNSEFNKALDRFKKDLKEKVNNELSKISNKLSEKMAKAFVKSARATLKKNSNPKDSNSKAMVEQISSSIHYIKLDNGKSIVRIPRSDLTMFLEYGTGIAGSYNEHPEAYEFGWKYVLHPEHYKRPTNIIENLKYNGYGWFYKKKRRSYLDVSDSTNIIQRKSVEQNVKGYFRKDGVYVKPYIRNKTVKSFVKMKNTVFTQGIKPVRFIYTAKQNIINMINESKTLGELNNKLNKIK